MANIRTSMVSDEIRYDARCPHGHITRLTFTVAELKEGIERGTLVLFCAVCDDARSPTTDEKQALLSLTGANRARVP